MSVSSLSVPLESIASCFEGVIPSPVCSCSADGVPNATYLSIVHRLDDRHLGLSNQFFNKTWMNIQENPRVQVIVVSPETGAQYRLDLWYERTESEGPAFESMKTHLEAVASQTGMSHVFRLRGLDLYRVLDCRHLSSEPPAAGVLRPDLVPALEILTARLACARDLDHLISTMLESLSALFGYHHSFVMVPDEDGKSLYTLASRGFQASGVGSEVPIGTGILGIAADRRAAVRNTTVSRDLIFSRAVRSGAEQRGEDDVLEKEIPLPGLADVESQLAVPLTAQDEFLGLLCLQSPVAGRFLAADERLMQIVARHLAAQMLLLRSTTPEAGTAAAVIKHFASDDSIFIDDAYVIKGLPGRIFWKLLQIHAGTGRVDFSNKEIRLDASLKLPEIQDNLETRLILLRRRLEDRCDFVRLVQTGRGQFRLELQRKVTLEEHS